MPYANNDGVRIRYCVIGRTARRVSSNSDARRVSPTPARVMLQKRADRTEFDHK